MKGRALLFACGFCLSLAIHAAPLSNDASARVEEAARMLGAVRLGADAATFVRANTLVDTLAAERAPGAAALDAWRNLIAHRFEPALAAAQRAQAEGDDSTRALACLADALVELGRYADAEPVVQTLLDRNAGAAALARASHLRMLHGDLDGARMLAIDALARATDGADRGWLALDLAELELMAGRGEAALVLARGAVGDAPIAALMMQARAQAALGQPRVALALWRAVNAHGPRVDALIETWMLAQSLGEDALAVRSAALLEGLARLDAAQGGRDRRSFVAYRAARGEWRDARALADADYEARPDVYGAAQLAWVLAAAGEGDAARSHALHALAYDTADPLLRWRAGYALAASGDEHGVALMKAARAMQPWLPAAPARVAAR